MNLFDKFDPLAFLNIDTTKLSQSEIDIIRSYLNAMVGEYILLKLSKNLTEEQITQLIVFKNKNQILNTLKSMVPDTENAIRKELENFKMDYSNVPPITLSNEAELPSQEVTMTERFPISPNNTDHIGRASKAVNLLRLRLPKKAALITAEAGLLFILACNPSLKSDVQATITTTEATVMAGPLFEQAQPQKIELVVVKQESLDNTKRVVITKAAEISPDIPELNQKLMEKIQPIMNLLPPQKRVKRIGFLPINFPKIYINGGADSKRPGITMYYRLGHPLLISELEIFATHEALHLLHNHVIGDDFGWDSELAVHFYYLRRNHGRLLEQRLEEMERKGDSRTQINDFMRMIMDGDRETTQSVGSLFNIVTEASYLTVGGHPWDNPSELFASTITVMQFFPNSFIASVNQLKQEDKQALISLAKSLINIIKSKAENPETVENLFSKDLMKFIDQ